MSWKSNAGSKVLEAVIDGKGPQKSMRLITSPVNKELRAIRVSNEVEQTVPPHTSLFVAVEFFQIEADVTTKNIEKLINTGGAFDFLKDSEERTYKGTDGDPV